MPVTNYYSVHGKIVGQKVLGQPASARVDYVTDALGSVVATADQTGAVVNRYAYKPYGGLLAKTGTAPDPAFTWVGSQGYRQTGNKYSDVYVRARHYANKNGVWGTADPAGYTDGFNLFAYTHQNPVTAIDRTGLGPGDRPKPDCDGTCKGCASVGNLPPLGYVDQYDWVILLALSQYCSSCNSLNLKNLKCQMWAERQTGGKQCTPTHKHGPNNPKTDINCGLFSISHDVWDRDCTGFGPWKPNVFDPVKNIQCAIKAMCNSNRGFYCNQCKWGTDCQKGNPFQCCKDCATFDPVPLPTLPLPGVPSPQVSL